MKNFLLAISGLVLIVILVIAVNTIRFSSRQSAPLSTRHKLPVNIEAVDRLANALQFKTISYDIDSLTDYTPFDSLISFLRESYPLAFTNLTVRVVNDHSLLMRWKGKGGKKPVILYAHLDVVPADTSVAWKYAPFSGYRDSKNIYGRGAIDDKSSMISILEAVEELLQKNFQPVRDIYLAFGHDEEVGGERGAFMMAEILRKENVKAEFLVDEGGLVATGMVPFVTPPVAMVFTSEKGYMSLELSVKGPGGHSSFPPANPPVEILSEAVQKIHSQPFHPRMTQSVFDFMEYTGPEMAMPYRALFANRWLFSPVIFSEYEKIPSANAMIRTTSVATVIQGGSKENVVPSLVSAVINFRLLPGESSTEVLNKIITIVDDHRIEIKIKGKPEEASSVSPHNSESFKILSEAIHTSFPDAIVAPSLLIAQTDSRHFRKVTENIYRFLPVRMDSRHLDTMHGNNEYIGIDEFMESILFYRSLVQAL